jgi:hypothetical protein
VASRRNLQRNLSVVQALDVARSAVRFGARVTILSRVGGQVAAAKDQLEEARTEGRPVPAPRGAEALIGEKGTVTG